LHRRDDETPGLRGKDVFAGVAASLALKLEEVFPLYKPEIGPAFLPGTAMPDYGG
jgi:hypothetical protein